MLEVQEYLLSGKTVTDLNTELGINSIVHPVLPLAILNYDMLNSPKTNSIVRECRGLVLNTNDWSLVSRSMQRFYNWGEVVEEMESFDFSNFVIQTKEDGSMVNMYQFNNNWMANTRGSFAQDVIEPFGLTWTQGFCIALKVNSLSELKLDPAISYICEFCSPFNKIVRRYATPVMYLLTAFHGEKELTCDEADALANETPLVRPQRFNFSSIEEVQAFINEVSKEDPTYEGVVIRDHKGLRFKCKSATYLGLHRLRGNGDNLFLAKNLLPFILTGEKDELLMYFAETKPALEFYEDQIKVINEELALTWETVKNEPDQKSFALKVKDRKFFAVYFTARRQNEHPTKVFMGNPKWVLDNLKPYKVSVNGSSRSSD